MDDYNLLTKEFRNERSSVKVIKLIKGDITKLEVDAIVNAAHEGVYGAEE